MWFRSQMLVVAPDPGASFTISSSGETVGFWCSSGGSESRIDRIRSGSAETGVSQGGDPHGDQPDSIQPQRVDHQAAEGGQALDAVVLAATAPPPTPALAWPSGSK